jgi:hypothetical protein
MSSTQASGLSWTGYMHMIEPQTKRLFKIVDKLIVLKDAGKQTTAKYQTLRTEAVNICGAIGDDFTDFADYFGI